MDAFFLKAVIGAVAGIEIEKVWEVLGIRRGYATAWSVAGGRMSTFKLLPFDLYVLSNNESQEFTIIKDRKSTIAVPEKIVIHSLIQSH